MDRWSMGSERDSLEREWRFEEEGVGVGQRTRKGGTLEGNLWFRVHEFGTLRLRTGRGAYMSQAKRRRKGDNLN